MWHVPQSGIHWVAEIVEEVSKPPKYTPEAVLGIVEEFELGLRRWYNGVHSTVHDMSSSNEQRAGLSFA